MLKRSISLVIIFSILLSMTALIAVPHTIERAHAASSLPIVGLWSTTYGNSNVTDPNLVAGSSFDMQVNLTGVNLPQFNGYEFALYFDLSYVKVTNWDLKSGMFTNPYAAVQYNGNGTLRLSVVNLGTQLISPPPSGTLLSITFQVVKSGGVSPLTLAAPMANPSDHAQPPDIFCNNCPAGAPNWTRLVAASVPIDVQTSDGYFDNIPTIASDRFGPTAAFSFTPSNPTQGETVKFNATNSFDLGNQLSNNHGISQYIWDFGDKSDHQSVTSVTPTVLHAFAPGGSASLNSTFFTGNFSVRLTVVDRDSGFTGMKTMLLTMSPVANHCVAPTIFINKNQVNPGQNITFEVDVKDSGTYPETYNLTVSYAPPNATLPPITLQDIKVGKTSPWHFSFATANFGYGVYNLAARVILSGGQDNCADGVYLSQFGINQPITQGQILLLVGGVVAVPTVLAFAAYAVGFYRKRKRQQAEAL